MRKPEDYLRLDLVKDVIEWQLDEVLDINGWDLKKALIQFQRGNAALFEWAQSPIVYQKSLSWDKVYEAAKQYFSKKAAVCHYYGTANKTYFQELQEKYVKYKNISMRCGLCWRPDILKRMENLRRFYSAI